MKQHFVAVSILLLFSIPLMLPFLKSGYFPTQDGQWAIIRLAEMHREIKDLQLPPRWSTFLNHGFGYPLFLFTYPFPYYLGEFFHLTGLSLVTSIKLLFVLTVIGSVTAMYFFAQSLFGFLMGIVVSLLYLYSPYRLTNLYVRGSIGESLALVFFPVLFWLVKKIFETRRIMYVLALALSLACFMLTHNATVVLFLPFLAAWILYCFIRQKKNSSNGLILVCMGILLGLLISSYFWLPAFAEKSYIALSKISLADKTVHFLTWSEIIGQNAGLGLHPPLQVGIVFIVVIGLASLYLVLPFNKNRRLGLFFGALTISSLFLLFSFSYPFWNLPVIKEIDFPWRMLVVVIFLIPLFAGSVAQNIFTKSILAFVACLAVLVSLGFIKTGPSIFADDAYYATNDASTTSADELMPIWVTKKPTNRPPAIFTDSLAYKISQVRENSDEVRFHISVLDQQPAQVVLNQLYFPGWSVLVDGLPTQVAATAITGLMTFSAVPGEHEVAATFGSTGIRMIADILTLVGVIGFGGLWIYSRKMRS